MPETWRPVRRFVGFYEVSSLGCVRRVGKGRGARVGLILKCSPDRFGYPTVELRRPGQRRKRITVHKLVAEAFICNGPVPDGMEVNHEDGIKSNCRRSNLKVGTRQYNTDHAWRTGLTNNHGENSSFSKLKESQVLDMRERFSEGHLTYTEAIKEFGVSYMTVYRIITRRTWRTI